MKKRPPNAPQLRLNFDGIVTQLKSHPKSGESRMYVPVRLMMLKKAAQEELRREEEAKKIMIQLPTGDKDQARLIFVTGPKSGEVTIF